MIDFDVESAVNAIAQKELTFCNTSFGYGQDPNDLTNVQLPAVVHWELGPVTADLGRQTKGGTYAFMFDIESRFLILEALVDEVLANPKKVYKDTWISVVQTFLNDQTARDLCEAANALDYEAMFLSPSFMRVSWPMTTPEYKVYWGIIYTHRFQIYA